MDMKPILSYLYSTDDIVILVLYSYGRVYKVGELRKLWREFLSMAGNGLKVEDFSIYIYHCMWVF